MALSHKYDDTFFASIGDGSERSAERIVPLLLSMLDATSVVDVGCGEGSWLSVFLRHGVRDVRGLDGGYVPASALKIPAASFTRCDLSHPFNVNRRFDLAICMETVEHLPESRAESLVADITQLSSQVLFSAAIPFQRGTRHVNCQWPDYWQALFNRFDYVAFDVIRPAIWDDETIEFWYRQNAILYIQRERIKDIPMLRAQLDSATQLSIPVRRLVHPSLCKQWDGYSVREILAMLPSSIRKALGRRLAPRAAA